MAFLASVPSVGFAVYDAASVAAAKKKPMGVNPIVVSVKGMENERYRITLADNGDVASIFDKLANKELLAAPITWEFIFDKPKAWPAWEIQYDDVIAQPKGTFTGSPGIKILEPGPVRGAMEITRKYGKSTFRTIIRLAAGSAGDRVEFVNDVDWREKETLLKAAFKVVGANDSVTYDLGLGTIERGIDKKEKYEVPAHQWADIMSRDGFYGVAVLNDCKYGWDHPDDSTLRLTLIHTPGVFENWSWVGEQSTQDIGKHHFTYAIMGHQGDWRIGNVAWQAARLNQPLVAAIPDRAHSGRLGKNYSLVSVRGEDLAENPQVMVNALKLAEDSDEVIVRVKELHGKLADNVTVRFANAILSAREVNGQEEEIGPARISDGVLVTSLTPYQPKAFAVKLFSPQKDLVATPVSQPLDLTYDLDGISTDGNRSDGDFDGQGNTLAGELLPEELTYNGAKFVFGPRGNGAKNVVSCNGQTLTIPAGAGRRVYLLMTAVGGPAADKVTVVSPSGERALPLNLYDYTERIGQWNNRVVNGKYVEEPAEIAPSFINHMPVAWYGSHRHTADGKNETYVFTYLYAVPIDLTNKEQSVVLPRNPRIKLLAATAVMGVPDRLEMAAPLYDVASAPLARIEPELTAFTESTTVRVSSPTPGATIHYTIDGSTPTKESPVYSEPLTVSETSTIRAIAVTQDAGDVHVSSMHVTKLIPRPADELVGAVAGLRCRYYEGGWGRLPNFDTIPAAKDTVVDTIAIPSFARPEDYGLVMQGYIKVPEKGMYEFSLSSDDGSKMWIGDTLLIDNDGIHGDGEVPGKVALMAGYHPITVKMFQAKGGQGLVLFVTGPDKVKKAVGKDMVFYVPPAKARRS